jgi:hypothetical protein
MNDSKLLLILAFGYCAYIVLARHLSNGRKAKELPLPPGPKTSWFGGVQLPETHQWLTYARWKDTFGLSTLLWSFDVHLLGDIKVTSFTSIHLAIQSLYWIVPKMPMRCSTNVATYIRLVHNEPWFLMCKYFLLVDNNLLQTFSGWGGTGYFRECHMVHGGNVTEQCFRRTSTPICLQFINPAKSKRLISCYGTYWLSQINFIIMSGGLPIFVESSKLNYWLHIFRTASAIILHITYGYTVADKNDSYVALADAAVHPLSRAGIFGTYLVDYIPILKHVPSWMPGASFKRQARVWHRLAREVLESQFNIVKENMVSQSTRYVHRYWQDVQAKGTAVSCVASRELEKWTESDQSADEEEVIKNITAIAYAGQSLFVGDIKRPPSFSYLQLVLILWVTSICCRWSAFTFTLSTDRFDNRIFLFSYGAFPRCSEESSRWNRSYCRW